MITRAKLFVHSARVCAQRVGAEALRVIGARIHGSIAELHALLHCHVPAVSNHSEALETITGAETAQERSSIDLEGVFGVFDLAREVGGWREYA